MKYSGNTDHEGSVTTSLVIDIGQSVCRGVSIYEVADISSTPLPQCMSPLLAISGVTSQILML